MGLLTRNFRVEIQLRKYHESIIFQRFLLQDKKKFQPFFHFDSTSEIENKKSFVSNTRNDFYLPKGKDRHCRKIIGYFPTSVLVSQLIYFSLKLWTLRKHADESLIPLERKCLKKTTCLPRFSNNQNKGGTNITNETKSKKQSCGKKTFFQPDFFFFFHEH